MPIYAYKCSSCGHTADVLQKMSADPLTDCPACGKSSYSKQVTAPSFQLKGSGWYVTDFKGEKKPAVVPAVDAAKTENPADAAPASSTESAGTTAGTKAGTPAATSAPAAAPTPAASSAPAKPAAAPAAST